MTRRVIQEIPGPEWARLFTGFSKSAFRLETRQHYAEPEEHEAFSRFRAGEDPKMDLGWWTDLARNHVAAGHTMSRVRVIVEPPSDYTRFELVAYPVMAAAGDDIRIISVQAGTWPTGLPEEDFWIFDERDVWEITYSDSGASQYASLIVDERAIRVHLAWRDIALAQAIPVTDYITALDFRMS